MHGIQSLNLQALSRCFYRSVKRPKVFIETAARHAEEKRRGQRIARQRGLIASNASLSDYEVANLIFAPGLSTKEKVTAISGRGVGLDAVKNFLEQYNGDIDIQLGPKSASIEGVPFRFHITLPASVCEEMQSVGGSSVASAS